MISLIKRAAYGYMAIMCAFEAIQMLPGSISVSVMQCTAFVTSVLGYFIAGDALSFPELIAIFLGTFGCIMLNNTHLFINNSQTHQRETIEFQQHPHHYLGLFFAILFTILNAFKFMTMSEMGNQLHSSVQTYWNGAVATIMAMIYFMIFDPKIFTGSSPLNYN